MYPNIFVYTEAGTKYRFFSLPDGSMTVVRIPSGGDACEGGTLVKPIRIVQGERMTVWYRPWYREDVSWFLSTRVTTVTVSVS